MGGWKYFYTSRLRTRADDVLPNDFPAAVRVETADRRSAKDHRVVEPSARAALGQESPRRAAGCLSGDDEEVGKSLARGAASCALFCLFRFREKASFGVILGMDIGFV